MRNVPEIRQQLTAEEATHFPVLTSGGENADIIMSNCEPPRGFAQAEKQEYLPIAFTVGQR